MMKHRSAIVALILLALSVPAAAPAASDSASLRVSIAGPVETVFRWATDACSRNDFPDTPTRALRGADGTVRLFISHHENRSLVGPSLDHLRHDCAIVYRGAGSDRPQDFDDLAWLISPYATDGSTVYALVHNEFHGNLRPALCPSGIYRHCWYNALTWAVSTDGGRSFSRPPGASALVATLPYRYQPDAGQPFGLFNPSNIVASDGWYYAFAFAQSYKSQRAGNCLLRTDRLDQPTAWRAWDGSGFGVRFADPYGDEAPPPSQTCTPVAPRRLTASIGSLVRHEPTGRFIVTFAGTRQSAGPGGNGKHAVTGVFASVSRDLIDWSEPTLVWEVPTWRAFDCDAAFSVGYPALLDPDSPSRNFETVGDTAYLYVTRYNLHGCRLEADRDLIRLPVTIGGEERQD